MLVARQLTIGWGERVLLRDLDFEIGRGEVFAIMGGSGCGKSTLMRALVGLETPLAGSVEFQGAFKHAVENGRNGGAPPFGVMFQSGALFGSLDLLENVALPLREWTRLDNRSIEDLASAKLALVGLSGFERFLPSEISGGMKKRAGIARALALDAPMIFLDEPSAGLDPITASELDDLMISLAADLDRAVVLVSHDLQSILRVGTRCILLDRDAKGIIATGTPRELRDGSSDTRVRNFFARDFAAEGRR
jgi:phospholipid/cholesterol/gamma-HCH transport system ATP-binding protein